VKVVIHHPVLLPPKDYGGVERVVLWLSQALIDLGHEVFVAALEGSRLPPGVHLISIGSHELSAIQFLKKIPKGVDVVHFMAPPEPSVWDQLPCAGILTIHGNGKKGEMFPPNTVFLTSDHAKRHGRKVFVWNGINPSEYIYREKSYASDQPLFLSKTSWKVKNLSGAILFASQAKKILKIAGGNRPYGLRFKAWLLGHQWEGPVSGQKKAELLSQASTLLFPVIWPEPFGLVVIESLMSGTPVIASPDGSLPEILGDCGILADPRDEQAWVGAIQKVTQISRKKCRERALTYFTHQHMAKNYLKLYQQVVDGKELSL
jgi:glycosyltransferase involved in cell wall biosynthesis